MKLLPSLHVSIRRSRFAPLTIPMLVLIAGCQENAPPPQTAQAPPPPVAYPPSPYAPPPAAWTSPQAPNAAPRNQACCCLQDHELTVRHLL